MAARVFYFIKKEEKRKKEETLPFFDGEKCSLAGERVRDLSVIILLFVRLV